MDLNIQILGTYGGVTALRRRSLLLQVGRCKVSAEKSKGGDSMLLDCHFRSHTGIVGQFPGKSEQSADVVGWRMKAWA